MKRKRIEGSGNQGLSTPFFEETMKMRSCGDCAHYRVCHVAKGIRDLYNSLPTSLFDQNQYEKIIEWGRSFAQFCRAYTLAEKETYGEYADKERKKEEASSQEESRA